jgi:hypothetical protein
MIHGDGLGWERRREAGNLITSPPAFRSSGVTMKAGP